jgi:hypothetical protein
MADAQDAQSRPQAAGDRDIVVTGRAEKDPSRSEISRQARAITRPQNMYHEPLARFEDPLCPGILGMKVEYAQQMVDRIRYNAEALDLWMGDEEGCRPNFIVAFVKDGQGELSALESKHGYLFRDLSVAERTELVAQSGPARVWTTTAMRTRDGMPVGESQGLTDPPVVSMWMAHSKIYLAVREDITQVVVLFDADEIAGKSLIQLADYATMRGLARTRPVEDDPMMDTILTLFHSDAPPPALTESDQAYLGALYDSIPNMPGITKLLGVNRQLRLQEAADAREAEAVGAGARE